MKHDPKPETTQLLHGRNWLFIAATLAIACAVVALVAFRKAPEPARGVKSVVLTEDGFEPAEMTIPLGTQVVFTTTRPKHFWPASNLHPTHELYSEFDPKEPVSPDKSWSFRFDKTGTWKYHDHIAPYYTGTITVAAGSESKKPSRQSGWWKGLLRAIFPEKLDPKELYRSCQGMAEDAMKTCYADAIGKLLGAGGIDRAFELLSLVSEGSGVGASICHELSHKIGQSAYTLFSRNKTFVVTDKTAYCAFGFYHGFMETLIARGGTVEEARKFCKYVDDTLQKQTANARLACYHGIGHGATDVHNPQLVGNERAMIAPALALCERFATTPEELTLCGTGVFDSIALGYYNHLNELKLNEDNPLWLCGEQKESFKESCYRDMMPAIIWLGGHELSKALPFVTKHAEEAYKPIAVQTLAEDSVRFIFQKNKDVALSIPVCRTLPQALALRCIEGLGSGIMQFGVPGKEYEKALAFCRLDGLTAQEENACYRGVLSYVLGRYDRQKISSICGSVPEAYREYCKTN